jgi:hypothetical protein
LGNAGNQPGRQSAYHYYPLTRGEFKPGIPVYTNLCHVTFHVAIYRLEEGLRSTRSKVEKIVVNLDQGKTESQRFFFLFPKAVYVLPA